MFELGLYTLGFILPYVFTCAILWLPGVFPQFWFWTVSYAGKYASAVPVVYGPDVLKTALDVVIGPHLLFWILALAGALWMWWDDRLADARNFNAKSAKGAKDRKEDSSHDSQFTIHHLRFFLVTFAVCSFGSISVGFHYRNHYFITLLPALALLGAIAFSRGVHLLTIKVKTLEIFLALSVVAVSGIAVLVSLIFEGPVWFGMDTEKAEMQIYRTTSNREAAKMAAFVRAHTSKDSRIAVVGSEPEIYFLSRRKSATGYIYTYPLVEEQIYAAKMQEDMIADIEKKRPEYVVYANDDLSWLRKPNYLREIDDWWKGYWANNLELIDTVPIKEWRGDTPDPEPAMNADGSPKCLILLRQKSLQR